MKKKQFNLLLNPDKGFLCKPVQTTLKNDGVHVAVGTFRECKKQADILNLQFEKI